jgi:hypothetical protein
MNRRELIALLGSTAVALPLAARAQRHDGMRHLGVLIARPPGDPDGQAIAAALVQGLGALNW